MERRLRTLTLIGCLGIGVLVLLIVLWQNGNLGTKKPAAPPQTAAAPSASEPSETVGETDPMGGRALGRDLSAFMSDPSFFDPERNAVMEAAEREQGHALSLLATSVEKDLRLLVVDFLGNPVEGESFIVSLIDSKKQTNEYRDLDRDGIIYVGSIASGEYEARLHPIEGYRTPEDGIRVRVKDKVEYIVIDDISVLLHTEEEIDAAKEDIEERDLAEDEDETQSVELQTGITRATVGIDVSKYQGEIDWKKVASQGIDFAIIRCGYRGRSTGTLVVDPYYEKNIREATAAGIRVGVYFFTQAVSEAEAVEEASAAVELVRGYELDLPIFIDTEGSGAPNGRADGLDKETRTVVCEAFCRTVKNAGYEAGVYASRSWFQNRLETERLSSYETWLAEYRQVPLYEGYYNTWQYTSRGEVPGITGYVDLDIRYEN